MRVRTLISAGGLVFVGLALTALAQTGCSVGEELQPPGARLDISAAGEGQAEIVSDWQTYIVHGFGGDASCQGAILEKEAICDFMEAHLRFELTINRQAVGPSYLMSFETHRGGDESAVCPKVEGDTLWRAIWVFEFPAGYFVPGVHILEGTWRVVEIPIECLECPAETTAYWREEGPWAVAEDSVSYDPHGLENTHANGLAPVGEGVNVNCRTAREERDYLIPTGFRGSRFCAKGYRLQSRHERMCSEFSPPGSKPPLRSSLCLPSSPSPCIHASLYLKEGA